jgi:hypothetical protein
MPGEDSAIASLDSQFVDCDDFELVWAMTRTIFPVDLFLEENREAAE